MMMTMMPVVMVMTMIVMMMTLVDPKHSPAELKLAIIRTHVPELHVWAVHKTYLTNTKKTNLTKPKKTKK